MCDVFCRLSVRYDVCLFMLTECNACLYITLALQAELEKVREELLGAEKKLRGISEQLDVCLMRTVTAEQR